MNDSATGGTIDGVSDRDTAAMGTGRRFLFIHQNFPGQFGPLAGALAAGGHDVVALGVRPRAVAGVRVLRYQPVPPATASVVPAARDVELKLVRGLACAKAMRSLADGGFEPDTIVAHPGWGEALFCKDVFPAARLLVLAEFFYRAEGADVGFDPEFGALDLDARIALRMRNTALLHALHAADGGYAPTRWQHAQIPAPWRSRFDVVFDGVDTDRVAPDPAAAVVLQRGGVRLRRGDEVISFVNRNLEPYRGFHVFMRALPDILARRPQARALIVGRDGAGYGRPPADGRSWRQVLLDEVGGRLPMDRVHFVGALPYEDYLRVLQVSACHVYLTYPFVLSWSCVEAMSAGCTVVGSATPPVLEFIEDGRHGLLVGFGDVAALADRVCAVLADPEGHRALGQAARERVRASFDLHRCSLPRLRALALGEATRPAP